jgi:hypothetical protein
LHLAHVWVIVSLNVLFVLLGLLVCGRLFQRMDFSRSFVLGVCILSLMSFVLIKYSAIPLTDMLFFCVSVLALASMDRLAAGQFSWRRMTGSVALVIAAVYIRRIGVALIPALLHMLVLQSGVRLFVARLSRRAKATILLVGTIVAISIAGAAIVWGMRTASTLVDVGGLLHGPVLLRSVAGIVSFHFKELGEIAVNLPYTALPRIAQDCLPVIGCLALLSMCAGIVWRKQFTVVETYFVSYLAVILVWPFYDPRFWLPVLPFLFAYSGLAVKRFTQGRVASRVAESYVMMFILLGMLTLASDTWLSFSGSEFGDSYTEGRYHATYCAVWRCKDSGAGKIDPDGLHLLRYYNSNGQSPPEHSQMP